LQLSCCRLWLAISQRSEAMSYQPKQTRSEATQLKWSVSEEEQQEKVRARRLLSIYLSV
jgi:hypothetical protein